MINFHKFYDGTVLPYLESEKKLTTDNLFQAQGKKNSTIILFTILLRKLNNYKLNSTLHITVRSYLSSTSLQ